MHNRIVNLLKKSAFTSFQRTYHTRAQQQSLYAGLFSHTLKNNAAFPQFDFDLQTPAVRNLRAAIKNGTHDAQVFSDPHCHRYLLYLIKNNHIDFWQGMTVYAYLIALMQYTKKQALHPEDFAVKIPQYTHEGVKIEYLSKDHHVTPFGKKYFETMQEKLAQLKINIAAEPFFQFATKLPPADSWMLRINYDNQIIPFDENYDKVVRIIIYSSPLIYYETTQNISHFYMPSFAVVRYLLKQISPRPLKMQPIFGKISDENFFSLHQNNLHPVAMYDPGSTNNLVKPHGLSCGPYPAMLHDVAGHAFWGTLLTSKERASIFTAFIPEIKKIMLTTEHYHLDITRLAIKPKLSLLDKFEIVMLHAIDFDLNGLEDFSQPDTRFIKYLARAFGYELGDFLYPSDQRSSYRVNLPIGDCQEDHVYFLLKQHFYQFISPCEPSGLWSKLLTYLQKNTDSDARLPQVLIALDVLARLTAGQAIPTPAKKKKIDWQAWQLLLENCVDSEALWNTAKHKHHESLLTLITDYHLNFFPPQHTLSSEQMLVFKAFIADNSHSESPQTWPEFVNNSRKLQLKP
jgi:hypothetical protein